MEFVCNPLTVITADICPHHKICKKHCVLSRERGKNSTFTEQTLPSSQIIARKKTALVVGSGPAGLAAAWQLAKCGFKVTVCEKENQLGGCLRLIPDVRLDKKHIDNLVENLKSIGVVFEVGKEIILQKNIFKKYGLVIDATGAWEPVRLNIKGADSVNVFYALDFLKNYKSGFKTVIIGGGNVAVDCGLKCGSNGIVCYRKTENEMKAQRGEVEYAKKQGVVFKFEFVPEEITSDGVWFTLGDEKVFLPCERVVIAAGQFSKLPDLNSYNNLITVGDAGAGRTTSLVNAVMNTRAYLEEICRSSNPGVS